MTEKERKEQEIKMEEKQKDLESGDNPEEREKESGFDEDEEQPGQHDLESGDNPDERKRSTED